MENVKKVDVIYSVVPKTSDWQNHKIKSNLEEKFVQWEIAESLSDDILKSSATRRAEQILLECAEMQKRNLEIEIEGLDNLELTIKTKTDKIRECLDSILVEQDKVFEEKHKEINDKIDVFKRVIANAVNNISEIAKPVNELSKTIQTINSYALQDFFNTIKTFSEIQERNPQLINFIIQNFKKGE